MAELKHTVDGRDVWVSFISRYREVNTYGLRMRGELSRDRVDIKDDGDFYNPDWIGSVTRAQALECVRAYEIREHAQYVQWAKERGYPGNQPPHAVCTQTALIGA